jgi:hypothetical protein
MDITRRGLLKLFVSLPAAFAVTTLTPAFAKVQDFTPVGPMSTEDLEDLDFFERSDIEIRFSDFIVYASSLDIVHKHLPNLKDYEICDKRGQYVNSELNIVTTGLKGRFFGDLGIKLKEWFDDTIKMGLPDSYKKDAEVWYKNERIAVVKGAFIKSMETRMFGNLWDFNFVISYDVLEHLNG